MEALNAASLTPISVLCERRTEPRKVLALPTPPLKLSNSASLSTNSQSLQVCLSKTFNGGLVLLSSVLASGGVAKALSYEEALQQTVGISTSGVDVNGILDSVISFATENPIIVAGGFAVVAVPLVVSQILSGSKPWGIESAKKAYAVLGDEANAQLLDIRAPVEIRKVGNPDIRGLGKKPVSVAYKGEDKPGFLKKLSSRFKEPENTTLFILDKFGENSKLVAELVTANGFKAAYAIKDGAEGPRGWMNSGLPWILPKKTPGFDLSGLTDAFSDAFGGDFDPVPLTFGIAAAAGVGALAFSEVETILQLLGSAALIQLVSKKFLFAEARKKTLQQVDEFLNTKVAPKELVSEMTEIGKALLPTTITSKALPAPVEVSSESAATSSEAIAEPKAEATTEAPPQINSVPNIEVKTESASKFPRPLSPYPSYPDFKPPTSPSPSQP